MGHYPVDSVASSRYPEAKVASSFPSDRSRGDCNRAGDIGAKVQQVAVEQFVGLPGRELEPSLRWASDGCAVAGASIADGECLAFPTDVGVRARHGAAVIGDDHKLGSARVGNH